MVTIIQDSREKRAYHGNVVSGLKERGINVVRSKLFVGDYTRVDNMSICIDLKQNMTEVYGNVIQQHDRFIRECRRAQQAGIRLIILVEQKGIGSVHDVSAWKNPRITKWEKLRDAHRNGKRMSEQLNPYPPVSSERLAKAMQTISDRYGAEWMFCAPTDTVEIICKVLNIP